MFDFNWAMASELLSVLQHSFLNLLMVVGWCAIVTAPLAITMSVPFRREK